MEEVINSIVYIVSALILVSLNMIIIVMIYRNKKVRKVVFNNSLGTGTADLFEFYCNENRILGDYKEKNRDNKGKKKSKYEQNIKKISKIFTF